VNWERRPLKEVADFCLGKMLDQNKNRGEALPYLANVNVRWGEFDFENLRQMRFEPGELERYGLKVGDIVMCEGGEPGRCAVWKDEIPGMMIQKALHRIRPHSCLDGTFLFYNFLKKRRNDEFSGLFTGSTIKHLPKEKLAKVQVDIPPISVQRRIADILSAYDDLSENNRRRIALLEEAARMLYREWFVHFRFPGHEHVRIIDGHPEGWVRGTIGDLFFTSSGGTPSRKRPEYFGGHINWLKTQEMHNNYIFDTDEKITDEAIQNSAAKVFGENTVLIAMYGATIGQLCVLAKPSASNQACCALIPKIDNRDYLFGYCLMEHSKDALKDRGQGSAQNNISQQVIKAFEVLIPKRSLISNFNSSVEALFAQRKNLQAQIFLLTQARDLLLPRLMNGEIAV
jgi:type I restriction enzyme S subunit